MCLGHYHWALYKPLLDSYPQPRKLLFFLSSLELWEVTEATKPALLLSDLIWPALLGFYLKKTFQKRSFGEQSRGRELCWARLLALSFRLSCSDTQYFQIFWYPHQELITVTLKIESPLEMPWITTQNGYIQNSPSCLKILALAFPYFHLINHQVNTYLQFALLNEYRQAGFRSLSNINKSLDFHSYWAYVFSWKPLPFFQATDSRIKTFNILPLIL